MVRFLALFLFPVCSLAQSPVSESGIFNDPRDGEVYHWVKIGEQVWMAENLRYQTRSGSYVYNYKDELVKTYGRLYTWETAMEVCPDGWHLPEGWEVSELYDQYGGMKVAGGALKLKGTDIWSPPNKGATNVSGFSAVPSGAYSGKLYLQYNSAGTQAYYWTSTEVGESTARVLQLGYNHTAAYDLSYHPKTWGLSVRCLRD